jgi:signal transduction histidine kinase
MSSKPPPAPRQSIRSALLGSYIVFAVIVLTVVAIFRAILTHGYDANLQEQVQILSHQGEDAIEDVRTTSRITAALTRRLSSPDEGLESFDASGNRVAAVGLMTNRPAGAMRTTSTWLPGVGNASQALTPVNEPGGWVRGTISSGRIASAVRQLDIGLAVGVGIALAAGALGANFLASRASDRVEYTLARMRDFTADAAHELRGPLMAITSNAELVVPRRDETDEQPLANIRLAARQMAEIMNDLLLLARSEDATDDVLYAVDLCACIDRLAHFYEHESKTRSISLSVRHVERATVYGNPDHLYRILDNLVRNAFRYTPNGGSVEIVQAGDRNSIFVGVTDTGIGIDPDAFEKIFERFWRADASRSTAGSGLGLAIARSLARRHGGEIYVQSRRGSGSTFTLRLPRRPVSVARLN